MVTIGMLLDNRYEILSHIGTGGMADVYKAKCHKLNRFVAVKVLKQEYNEDAEFVKRFRAEAQATAGLTHPNIVQIFDIGYDLGLHFIVMELAEGMTLKQYIRRYGRLSVRETVDFSTQIASALRAAHNHHIIHRDIKPHNIMVADSGKIMVTDFGIARVATSETLHTTAMGSAHYISPEQARGVYSDEKSDIYSLGITMYEMATGKVPFDGENSVAIALKHLREEITPPRCYFPDIPESLERIILKCTRKQSAMRYQSADELLRDLGKVFSNPDGDYIYMDAGETDSPTRIRTKEEIDQISQSLQKKEDTLTKIPDLPIEEAQEEEDDLGIDEGRTQLEKIALAATVVVGVGIAIFVLYMVASMMHILPSRGEASSTESTRPATSTETTQGATTQDTAATTETTTASTTEAQKVEMPYLVGDSREKAEEILLKLNLIASFEYESDVKAEDHYDKDLIVMSQSVKEGTEIEEGSRISLALGWDSETVPESKKIDVPPLVNLTEEAAQQKLLESGLDVKKAYANSDSVEKGYIIQQSPTAGTTVDEGFTVTITVSRGRTQAKVPPLYGVSKSEASRLLGIVGLELGDVSQDYSGDVGVGDVINQDIKAGTMVEKGTKVSITISLGEKTISTYEGNIMIAKSPFAEGETGSISLTLMQGSESLDIYSNDNASSDLFPFYYTFEGIEAGSGTVIVYVNGEEYDRYDVSLSGT